MVTILKVLVVVLLPTIKNVLIVNVLCFLKKVEYLVPGLHTLVVGSNKSFVLTSTYLPSIWPYKE